MGYRRFQIGCVFIEYDLFNTTTFIQNCIYINFSRQEHQIDVYMYRLTPEILRFHPIPYFMIFSFTVPLTLSFTFWYTYDLHISLKIWDPLHLEY